MRTTRGIAIVSLGIVLCHAAVAFSATGAPDAILCAVTGKVSVQNPQGKVQYVTGNTPLRAGDRVFAGANSRASVIFPNRPPQEVRAGQSLLIEATAAARSAAANSPALTRLWSTVVARFRSCFLTERQAPPAVSRDLDGVGVPRLLSPCWTAIPETQPVFRWTGVAGAQSYLLTVLSRTGRQTFTRVVEGTECAVPSEVAPLTAGELYVWCVADAAQPEEVSRGAWFRVLSSEQRDAYDESLAALNAIYAADPPQRAELAGYLAADYGLNVLAAQALETALQARPDDVAIRRTLARVYEAMERGEQAVKVLEGLSPVPVEQQNAWSAVATGGAPTP